MKWFKHLSNSMDDEKIAALICNGGMEMYGYWWAVLEIVARHVDKNNKCSVAYPIAHWSRLLYTPYQRVTNVLGNLEATGLLQLSKEGTTYTVTISNLLKYRDEYSKKSGVSPDKKPTDSGAKKQKQNIDTEKDNTTTTTRAENQLLESFKSHRSDLERLFPDINLDVAMAKLITRRGDGPILLDPYETILKWMQTEFKPVGGTNANGKGNTDNSGATGNSGRSGASDGSEGAELYDEETIAFCSRDWPEPGTV